MQNHSEREKESRDERIRGAEVYLTRRKMATMNMMRIPSSTPRIAVTRKMTATSARSFQACGRHSYTAL
jgi:hypothetical protein